DRGRVVTIPQATGEREAGTERAGRSRATPEPSQHVSTSPQRSPGNLTPRRVNSSSTSQPG
ncbi:MAG: hypothetical protein ACK5F7_19470, partial [Planctomycetaceae bacterium]